MDSRYKCRSGREHCSHQRRTNTSPKSSKTISTPGISKSCSHVSEFSILSEPIALHLGLDHVEWVCAEPQYFSCQSTVECDVQERYFFSCSGHFLHVVFDECFVCHEPEAIPMEFSKQTRDIATKQSGKARLLDDLPKAVLRTSVYPSHAIWLGL